MMAPAELQTALLEKFNGKVVNPKPGWSYAMSPRRDAERNFLAMKAEAHGYTGAPHIDAMGSVTKIIAPQPSDSITPLILWVEVNQSDHPPETYVLHFEQNARQFHEAARLRRNALIHFSGNLIVRRWEDSMSRRRTMLRVNVFMFWEEKSRQPYTFHSAAVAD